MAKYNSPLRLALYSILPCVIFFGLLELGAVFLESEKRPLPLELSGGFSATSRVFIPDSEKPGVMRTSPQKTRAFLHQEFTTAKPEGGFRIAVLGESSVYYLQTEFEALAPRLKKELGVPNVDIINAGGQSYGSERLALVAKELLDYSPDFVFIYIGHNEFEEAEQLALIRPELSGALQLAYDHSALIRVAVTALSASKIRALEDEHKMRLLSQEPNTSRAWRVQFTERDVALRMRTFRGNISSIIELFRSRGIPVLISTVPSNLVRPYLPKESLSDFYQAFRDYKLGKFEQSKTLARKVLREARGRHQSSDLENAILRELVELHKVPLLDMEKLITEAEPNKIPGETLFADHCHLNEKGNRILAEALFEILKNQKPAR